MVQDMKIDLESIKKTQTENPGVGQLREEIRNHKCKHHQQNTKHGKEIRRW